MAARPVIDEQLLDEALAWHHALARDDADWDAYVLWLEADPRHSAAFDEIALTNRIVEERVSGLDKPPLVTAVAEVTHQPVLSRRKWLYGSIAAGLALAISIPALWPSPQDIVHETGRGETRHVSLAGGIEADLAPFTRLIAQGGDPSKLELAQGSVYFNVAHDPKRNLLIKAGEYAVRDIGTVFTLNLSPETVALSVAEGQVAIAAEGDEATQLPAGRQLIARRHDRLTRITSVAPGDVGSWRRGQLVYQNTPLSVVAADIARYSGKTITVDPTLADQPFSGILAIGDGSGLLASLSALMDVAYEEKDDRVRIGAARVR